jgi:hypothetical protein
MEKKMKINRLIFIGALIGSSVFASFYGGNISYALFYLTLLIPVMSFLYTLYVYFRFKIYQTMDAYLVVKGDWTTYSFVVANEDYITFRNIKVNFLSDKSTIETANKIAEYSLLPSESERLETRIKCNYRGEYHVGVDSIEVTDFLYLFNITYPIATKLKAVVLPRVVPLERLGIAPPQNDVKNPTRFSNSAEEELDTEVRKYFPVTVGREIHWKATARLHQLITRKIPAYSEGGDCTVHDLMKIKDDELKVVIAEDKIVESVLAIANFYAQRGTPSQIIYELEGLQHADINSRDDFNVFYKACVRIDFKSKLPVSMLLKEHLVRNGEGVFYVVATHNLTRELYLEALKAVSAGNHVCILFVSDDVSEETKKIIDGMKNSGIDIYQIMSEDEIADILSQEII